MEVRRATPQEKRRQLDGLNEFEARNKTKAAEALQSLRRVVLSNGNIFEEMLDTVRHASLGQIANLLYEVGGRYRRNT